MVKIPVKKAVEKQFYALLYPDKVNFKSEFLMCTIHADSPSRISHNGIIDLWSMNRKTKAR